MAGGGSLCLLCHFCSIGCGGLQIEVGPFTQILQDYIVYNVLNSIVKTFLGTQRNLNELCPRYHVPRWTFWRRKQFLVYCHQKNRIKLIVLDFQPSAKQETLIEYFQRRLPPCGFPFRVGNLERPIKIWTPCGWPSPSSGEATISRCVKEPFEAWMNNLIWFIWEI